MSAERDEVNFDSLDVKLFVVLLLTTLRAAEGRLRMPGDAFKGTWPTQFLIWDCPEVMPVLSQAM